MKKSSEKTFGFVFSFVFLTIGLFRFALLKRKLYKWNKALYADSVNKAIASSEEKKEIA